MKIEHREYKLKLSDFSDRIFSQLRVECQRIVKVCYTNYINTIEESIKTNIKFFSSHLKNMKKEPSVPDHMHLEGRKAGCPGDVCNLFAEHFPSVFGTPDTELDIYDFGTPS